jgi:hypothetical protein
MTRRPVAFRKADVARAVQAVREAGIDIARIEIDKDGKIVVVTTTTGTTQGDIFDQEIEQFRKAHGYDKTRPAS